jgi:hypothetical protein
VRLALEPVTIRVDDYDRLLRHIIRTSDSVKVTAPAQVGTPPDDARTRRHAIVCERIRAAVANGGGREPWMKLLQQLRSSASEDGNERDACVPRMRSLGAPDGEVLS